MHWSHCLVNLNYTYVDAGSVTNGIVNLNLPNKISDKYLSIFEEEKCSIFPEDIQYYQTQDRYYGFVITNDEDSRDFLNIQGMWFDGEIEIDGEIFSADIIEGIDYIYFSKAGKITCNYEYEYNDAKFKIIKDIDAKAGWNKIYFHRKTRNSPGRTDHIEESTNNILKNETELKWFLGF